MFVYTLSNILWVFLLSLVVILVLYSLFNYYCYVPIKYFFTRKSRYSFERIPGAGDIIIKYEWFKTNEEAELYGRSKGSDFVTKVYPKRERVYPTR